MNNEKECFYNDFFFGVIARIFDCAGDTDIFAEHLVKEIRDLNNAQFAVLAQNCEDGIGRYRPICIFPEHKKVLAKSAGYQRFYACAKDLKEPIVISSKDNNVGGDLLAAMGFDLALIVPLTASERQIGAIFSIGLSQTKNIETDIEFLKLLSSIVSLVFRNAFLIEKHEELLAEKTWDLMKSNDELKRKEKGIIALVAESERSRRALLDVLEEWQFAKKREDEIRTKMMELQKLEAVGRLAGGVAHDFNNALSVIIGYTELVLKKLENSNPIYDDLTEVLKAAKKSAGITRQLLAFARKQVVEPVLLDINDAIEKMLKMLHRLLREEIELSWSPGYNLGHVLIDPSQIDQIMINLAVNSRDAISGQGKISIQTKRQHYDEEFCATYPEFEPGDYVEITFSDNGCGISEENLPHIFEPFFTTKKIGEGTGLGLATVYGIVRQNRGFINVSSKLGKGTTFRIYLPVAKPPEKQVEEIHVADNLPKGKGEKLLVVEDDPQVLAITKIMLEQLGYQPLCAKDAQNAYTLTIKNKSDLKMLITDIIMPETNGRELASKIQKIIPDIKVLYMSGYTADVIAKKGLLETGLNFIEKPFSIERLSKKVKKVLDENK